MATLVLLKEKGSSAADLFRGTFNGPDDNPSEWDYIIRDSRFQSKLQFLVLEYVDPNELPAVYKSKLRKVPQLFFSVPGTQPIEYRDKLAYPAVQNWLFQQIVTSNLSASYPDAFVASAGVVAKTEEPPELIPGNSINLVSSESSSPKPTTDTKETATPSANQNAAAVPLQSKGMSMSGVIIGGGLILFGVALVGAIVGEALASGEEESNPPQLLTYDDGTPVDFSTIKWEEEAKPSWLPSWLKRKKKDESNTISGAGAHSLLGFPSDPNIRNSTPFDNVNPPSHVKKSGKESPGLLNGDDEAEAEL